MEVTAATPVEHLLPTPVGNSCSELLFEHIHTYAAVASTCCTDRLTTPRQAFLFSNGECLESARKIGELTVVYLSELPHCPTCNRVLRTKNGRDWCIECHAYVDNPIPGVPRWV